MSGGNIERIRMAVNGVAAHPVRLTAVEAAVAGKPRNEETAEMAGQMAIQGAEPLRYNGYKVPLMRNLVKRAIRGEAARRRTWTSSSGRQVRGGSRFPIHIAWTSCGFRPSAGLLFLIVHAIYVTIYSRSRPRTPWHPPAIPAAGAARIPERVPRHSLARGCFTAVMALAMFALLFTAFLPKVGVQFPWVTYHWIAGIVLTISVLYHIIHASFWLDFWSIWPDKDDIEDARKQAEARPGTIRARAAKVRQVSAGKQDVPPDRDAGRACGDRHRPVHDEARAHAVLHAQSVPVQRHDLGLDVRAARAGGRRIGRAGHGAHLLRDAAGKMFITKSMIFGSISRENYLEHHDPQRWVVAAEGPAAATPRSPRKLPPR